MKNTFKKNSYARGEMWIAFVVLFGVVSSSFTSSQAASAVGAADASAGFRDSLMSEPVMSTLVRLHKEAEVADRPLAESYGDDYSDPDKRAELIKHYVEEEARDYKEIFHGKFATSFLSVTPEFGNFLYSCVRATNATRIVEFGTSFGLSTIYLAAGVRDNGGGQIISTELVEAKALQARRNLEAAGLSDLVEIRVGDALETLRADLGGRLDLLHLDGAPSLYFPVFQLVETHLRACAFVIAENAYDQVPDYLGYVRDPKNGYHSTRIQVGEAKENEGRGNELTVVLGRP